MHIDVKRIYDDPASEDGTRVLVDRLWPRGVSKDDAAIDHWCKNLAPSSDLRQWFDHDSDKFDQFAKKYRQELHGRREAIDELLEKIDKRKRLTLLTATRDLDNSHVGVLKDVLKRHAS